MLDEIILCLALLGRDLDRLIIDAALELLVNSEDVARVLNRWLYFFVVGTEIG